MFGISYRIVLACDWVVTEAINTTPDFKIEYLKSLEEQRKIAYGFQKASKPGINICASVIDGILIWTLKPSFPEAKSSGIDQKKFLCALKHKFGLNCQAVSDCHSRIIDISIAYGGATADCLAFEASDL